tara:strand:+ start:796 stop:1074 length:279 start_codon:yes stop_codon:yes gene_type:complete
MKTLYIYRHNHHCITHDGYMQLGIHSHSLERHLELCPSINWIETYWLPDIFSKRYKRASFQTHERVSDGKDSIEQRPRDFPDQPQARLDRSV